MDKESIKTAVKALIKTPRYTDQKRYILETVAKWPKRQVILAGEDAQYNPLVALGVESLDALNNVFTLAERKRRLSAPVKKIDYQRDYMRQRRKRLMTAIKLEQIVSGKKMDAEERDAYGAMVLSEWTKQREEELAKFPDADWKERNVIVAKFWEKIDRRLDTEYNKALAIMDAPNHRVVRKVQVKKPVGILGEKLESALKNRKR